MNYYFNDSDMFGRWLYSAIAALVSLFFSLAICVEAGQPVVGRSNRVYQRSHESPDRQAERSILRSVPIGLTSLNDEFTEPHHADNLLFGFLAGATICPAGLDSDYDGWDDCKDNCPFIYNPGQADYDSDGLGDACEDWDGDGVMNFEDNCINTPNAQQEDRDSDGIGDLCDGSCGLSGLNNSPAGTDPE